MLRYLALLALAVVAACANQPSSHVCASGIICPDPLQCAAVQQVCITNNCGNGVVDQGETCDDGNIIDGDGCAADCHSKEACGDGFVNVAAGEVCDDGNTVSGDGCSADCKSVEICGNGIVDVGEVCDDGGTHNGKCSGDNSPCNSSPDCGTGGMCVPDGCAMDCKSNETCGNGIVDLGEVCDDHNTVSGDSCESDCKSGSGCGNGVHDPGEQCDDGNTVDNDDCHNNCTIDVCGDHIVNSAGVNHEDCDPGTGGVPLETAACNVNCRTPTCGDGIVNAHFKPDGSHGEQCDAGGLGGAGNAYSKDCTADCLVNICGDGHPDTAGLNVEECDDGNTNDHDGCSNACTTPSCGNGIVDLNEECDLGAGNNGASSACPSCKIALCGDGIGKVETGVEQCDPGTPGLDTVNCNRDCTTPSCGDGKVNPAFTPSGAPGGEQCDPPDATKGCSAKCQLQHCGNGQIDALEECDNGAGNNANGPCLPSCRLAKCGDGVVESSSNSTPATEQCDRGQANGTTACPYGATSCSVCTSNCQTTAGTTSFCGNSLTDGSNGETCDNGAANGATSCAYLPSNHNSNPCTVCTSTCVQASAGGPYCGDGAITNGETCDDGFSRNGTTLCSYGQVTCQICKSDCSGTIAGTPNFCGDGNADGGEACDSGANNGQTSCTYLGGGTSHSSNACTPCTTTCTVGSATGPYCGDGAVTNGEACDDGFGVNGTTACPYGQTSCTICKVGCDGSIAGTVSGYCGDGTTTSQPESCDQGGKNGTTTCDYGTASCSICNATCSGTSSGTGNTCGDGTLDPNGHEVCDDHNASSCGTCSSNCKVAQSSHATGVIIAVAGNQVTDGDTFTLNDGINAPITFEFATGLPSGSHVKVNFNSGDNASTIANDIRDAINGVTGTPELLITASASGAFVTLTHDNATTAGNVTQNQTLADGIVVFGMSGGLGGDCAVGIGCASNADCASGSCDTVTTHLCQ